MAGTLTHTHVRAPANAYLHRAASKNTRQQTPNLPSWLMWRWLQCMGAEVPDLQGWIRISRCLYKFSTCVVNNTHPGRASQIEQDAATHPTERQQQKTPNSTFKTLPVFWGVYSSSSFIENGTRHLHATAHKYFTWEWNMKRMVARQHASKHGWTSWNPELGSISYILLCTNVWMLY